jgi:hypothetical protein
MMGISKSKKEGVLVGQVFPGTGARKQGSLPAISQVGRRKPVKNVSELVKEISKKSARR